MKGAGQRNPECASFEPIDNNAEDPMSVGIMIDLRKVQGAASRRQHAEQGIRAGVPGEQARHGRPDARHASRAGELEFAGPRARGSPARRHHQRRHAQGRRAVRDAVAASRRPGLEDVWQIHFSLLTGQEYTVPGAFIANHDRSAGRDDANRRPGRRRCRASRRRPLPRIMGSRTTSR